jgi:homoserine O-acetyltransferase
MVLANYKLLTEHLNVDHLRLVMGTDGRNAHLDVGCTYPDFMDALMPLASLPVEIAGRNRIQRKMAIKLVEMDPMERWYHATAKIRHVRRYPVFNVYG